MPCQDFVALPLPFTDRLAGSAAASKSFLLSLDRCNMNMGTQDASLTVHISVLGCGQTDAHDMHAAQHKCTGL